MRAKLSTSIDDLEQFIGDIDGDYTKGVINGFTDECQP